MRAFKIIGISLGGLAALVGGIFALALMLTAGATHAADDFVKLVGESRYEQAYEATAPAFKKATSLETFRSVMQRVGLDKAEGASWTSRAREDSSAKIEGTVRLRDGRTLAATIHVAKIDGTWRVLGVEARPQGAS
jgi:hypothetical protein